MNYKEHEILAWLIGLISTDGCIGKYGNSYPINIVSVEKNWLERIKTILSIIRFETTISKRTKRKTNLGIVDRAYILHLKNPRTVFELFQKYPDLEQYCNPRKWKRIQEAIECYKHSRPCKRFSVKEIQFLKENHHKLTDREIAEILHRSRTTIATKRRDLKIWKQTQKKWTPKETQFLRENYLKLTDEELGKKLNRGKYSIQEKRQLINLWKFKKGGEK